ncbi:hypothetical protein [Rhodococcus aetherivorans]|uniref:hypothetical protein n=1 Tax=Rhodococcus aetherivorans TaxID=191292 RepID=UPI00163AF3C6|nr:hypothetical protein [Rhodococcus aetherivorans]MBC2592536.1 hypothetical protein [Rhodococcus aetherivorans]
MDETTFRAPSAARGSRGGEVSAEVMTPAKQEANRRRATKSDLATALEYAL